MPDETPPAAPATPPAAPAIPPATPPAAPPPAAPEKYDLKLPDNALLDAAHVDKAAAFAQELKLPNDKAQALLERDNANIAAYVEGQKKQFEQQAKEWVETMKTDKDIGGEAFPKNVEMAKRVVGRFGSTELQQALDSSGLGNHPGLVKMLVQIGKAMSEDQLVLPGSSTPSAPKKSMEEKFYGGTENK